MSKWWQFLSCVSRGHKISEFIKPSLDGSMHPCNLTLGHHWAFHIWFSFFHKCFPNNCTLSCWCAKKSLHSVSVSFYFISLFFSSIWWLRVLQLHRAVLCMALINHSGVLQLLFEHCRIIKSIVLAQKSKSSSFTLLNHAVNDTQLKLNGALSSFLDDLK